MGDALLQILIFAMVAVILVLRLRSVLGKRTGHERQRHDPRLTPRSPEAVENAAQDNVVPLPDRQAEAQRRLAQPGSALAAGITQITVHDPTFDAGAFVDGAKVAFEMIVGAFAAGDRDALRPLLSREVYGNFVSAIDARERAQEQLETTIVGINSAELIEAEMQGREAVVTVKFVSDQINVTRDPDGRVTDGDPERIVEITDIWTFQRDTRAGDPNWELVATRVPN
jgi:predicted lipid-binding transport protein (Tim44 family)